MGNVENNREEKQWSFTDDVTQFVAYKSRKENDCYLENIKHNQNVSRKKRQSKVLYASTVITKPKAWQLAGGRIVDFCNGRNIFLLQTMRPAPGNTADSFFNEITINENDILSKRIADIISIPLKARAKRQIYHDQREKSNKSVNQIRQRRQINQFRGKFRGQTQSQYLNFGNNEKKEGKAEAEATQQSSRAIVSGSRGMGQAQSMSSGGTGCEDCPGYSGIQGTLDKIRVPAGTVPGTPITQPGAKFIPGVTYPGSQITYPGVTPGQVSPGVLPGSRPGTYLNGVRPGTVIPGTDGTFPGGVHPGTVAPGTIIPGTGGTFPGGVRPGTVAPGTIIPGTGGTFPGGVHPGTVAPGTIIPGTGGTFPGGVRPGTVAPGTIIPGTGGTFPGGVHPGTVAPGTIIPGTGGTFPGGVHPGTVAPGTIISGTGGTYPGVVRPGTVTPGTDGTYFGGIQPGVVMPGGTTYPPGTIITGDRPYPAGVVPGNIMTEVKTRPDIAPGVQPGQGIYSPGGVVTTSVATGTTTVTGVGNYPPSTVSATGLPSGTYPGVSNTGTYPGTGIYPGDRGQLNIPGTNHGSYPSTVVPEGTSVYPGGGQTIFHPQGVPASTSTGSQAPGIIATTGTDTRVITYPNGQPTSSQIYPHLNGNIQPGKISEGIDSVTGTRVMYPGVRYPETIPGTYTVGAQQITSPGENVYPSQILYPSGVISTYPGGSYPGANIGIPETGSISTGTTGRETIGETGVTGQLDPGQLSGRINGQGVDRAIYPGTVINTETGGVSQIGGPSRPAGSTSVTDDGTESQATSSVHQVDSGTQASASAQGKHGSGTAQSQVTGTYSGSGTFSAQAGTSDSNKSAQTEISGGKDGATSNAQGTAGFGKSQTQVQLDSDSGATSTGAQSSGWNHGTNSQVQASSKGGMADAQANGEGSTSSQAQIGFQPYVKSDDEKAEEHGRPFRGSGIASAQSGTYQGQSQSQLQGSFQYGITYTGGAQAGSGSGAASSRKPFNFTGTELFKSFKPTASLKQSANIDSALSSSTSSNYDDRQENKNREQGLQSSSTTRQTVVLASKNNLDDVADKKAVTTEKSRTDDTTYDEYDDDYADEEDYSAPSGSKLTTKGKFAESFPSSGSNNQKVEKIFQQQSRSQSQTIQVAKGNQYNVQASQNSNLPRPGDTLQPGQSVSGYTIPPGFRGRVTSVSGTETVAQGDGKSQSQTVSLVPKDFNNTKPMLTETRSLQTNYERYVSRPSAKNQGSLISQSSSSDKYTNPTAAIATKPSYYTVTNSFAGKMNGNNEPKKYEHRYYTKSSTCGYFTFSCNVVYGSNGRTKICKPKVPTYSNGTPIRC
ncbi:hypothetical protein PUN28_015153 [Cardiocondyla obscurior]